MNTKKIIAFVMALIMAFCETVTVFASEEDIKITSHSNWEVIDRNDASKLRWKEVDGAAGYRVTVKNNNSGEYYTQNEWVSGRSYDLQELFDDELGSNEYPALKIWVGAMRSEENTGVQAFSSTIIYLVVSAPPELSGLEVYNIGEDSATIGISVDRDYGVEILQEGILIGTSNKVSRMDFYDLRSTSKGPKEITISDLEPDTTYFVRGYALNEAGESITDYISFTTAHWENYGYEEQPSSSSENEGFDWEDDPELTLSDDYPEDEEYTEGEKEEPTPSFSVNKDSIKLGWGSGNEELISVTGSDWEIEEIKYDVPNTAIKAGYDYKWIVAEQYGNEILVRPTRANYSLNERKAVIVLSCGGKTKKITVTQEACGEPKPTMSMMFGGKLLENGDKISLEEGQELDIEMSSTKTRKVFAQLIQNKIVIDDCSDLNNIRFGVLKAGNYIIKIWASNSPVDNDYYAERINITLNVEVVKKDSEEEKAPVTVPKEKDSAKNGNIDLTDNRFDKTGKYTESIYYNNLKSIHLTGNYADDIVKVALSQEGYGEVDGKSAYGMFYGNTYKGKDGAWCAYFVSFCSGRAGVPNDIIGFSAGANPGVLVPNGEIRILVNKETYENKIKSWKAQERENGDLSFPWLSSGRVSYMNKSDYVPKKGDLVFWGSTGGRLSFSHVGLVTTDSDGITFSYIDGNGSGDDVSHQIGCHLAGFDIVAYARPNYSGSKVTRAQESYSAQTVIIEDINPPAGNENSYSEEENVSSGEEITFIGQSGEYIKVRETEKESSNGFFNNVWNWIKELFGF